MCSGKLGGFAGGGCEKAEDTQQDEAGGEKGGEFFGVACERVGCGGAHEGDGQHFGEGEDRDEGGVASREP